MDSLNEFRIVRKEVPSKKKRSDLGIFEINAPFKNLGGLGQLIPFKNSKKAQCKNKVIVENFMKDQAKVVSSLERRKTNNFSVSFLSHNNRNLKIVADHPNSNFSGIKELLEYKGAEKEHEVCTKSSNKLKSKNQNLDEIFSPTAVKRNMQSIGSQLTDKKKDAFTMNIDGNLK